MNEDGAVVGPVRGPLPPRPRLPVRLARYANRWTEPPRAEMRRAARRALRRAPAAASLDHDRQIDDQWRWSSCYAPTTGLYLDQFGKVRACCQNTDHPLGDISQSTLREIWQGPPAQQLRRALSHADHGMGCDFCAWEVQEAGAIGSFARQYDGDARGLRLGPRWPVRLEFAVTNTCNLSCVMCNGDWSSAIRARREHRPPLVNPYPERFFDELIEFAPHLRYAHFTGGEPFLGRESLRIMELLVEHGPADLNLAVVTNATTLGPRVERILRRCRPWISVSIDGGTAEVYERIRVGAQFDQVMANVDRLIDIVRDHGNGMTLTHCLMVDNWSTFPEFLQLAEARHLEVAVNTVRFPEAHSLYHLAPQALAEVVRELTARDHEVRATLTGARLDTWYRQLGALARRASSSTWPTALGLAPTGRVPVAVEAPRRRDAVTAAGLPRNDPSG